MRQVYGMKVTRLTLGDLPSCPAGVLPAPQGVGMGRQKSAEAIVVGMTDRRRAEHEEPDGGLAFR